MSEKRKSIEKEFLNFDKSTLKPTYTNEKDLTDIEKQPSSEVLSGVESFDKTKLHHTETKEPHLQSNSEKRKSIGKEFLNFDKSTLKPTYTNEKDLTDIEKQPSSEVLSGVESFDKTKLHHTETKESHLQSKAEKRKSIEKEFLSFDKTQLKPTYTNEKDLTDLEKAPENKVLDGIENFNKKNLNETK